MFIIENSASPEPLLPLSMGSVMGFFHILGPRKADSGLADDTTTDLLPDSLRAGCRKREGSYVNLGRSFGDMFGTKSGVQANFC